MGNRAKSQMLMENCPAYVLQEAVVSIHPQNWKKAPYDLLRVTLQKAKAFLSQQAIDDLKGTFIYLVTWDLFIMHCRRHSRWFGVGFSNH